MDNKILLRLIDFLDRRNVDYAITGTAALSILGFPSNFTPADIDIKVYDLNEEQASMFAELEMLSGLENAQYEDSICYSFMVGGVKVNAISSEKTWEEINNIVDIKIKRISTSCTMHVQNIGLALKEKMKLRRPKDINYMLDSIKCLTNL